MGSDSDLDFICGMETLPSDISFSIGPLDESKAQIATKESEVKLQSGAGGKLALSAQAFTNTAINF